MHNLSRITKHLFLKCNRKLLRSYSSAVQTETQPAKYSFEHFIRHRQSQAQRSIVVQVCSEKSYTELYSYCSHYGNIVDAQHYSVQQEESHHYILLEFEHTEAATAAIDSSSYNEELSSVPVRSPFLWFKANKGAAKNSKLNASKPTHVESLLRIQDGLRQVDSAQIQELLHAAEHVEQQIQLLHQHTQLSDLGVRLRFLAALQVQAALTGMFPAAEALPFGSSVNGFGRMGCDLDLILRFDGEAAGEVSDRKKHSRLVFHVKENLGNGRSQTQRQMESLGDMLQLFLPGVCHVRRILQARVPIIKYHHEHLDLEVDLSLSNLSGFYMSELLYLFGELDERVRPLIFSVRLWAKTCGLTNPTPGRWISNFSLTCLVIYFLQQIKQPVLPTINAMAKCASKEDIRITEDGVNCTFARDLERIAFRSNNRSRINELLLHFFEFYSQFDFQNRAISLNEGRTLAKPDHSAIYIVNPLEMALNVSKNVSLEECERLRMEVRNAAWVLESEVENPKLPANQKLDTPWGLLNLFKSTEKSIIKPNMFFKPRMVEVSELFDAEGKAKAKVENVAVTAAKPADIFKNNSVQRQVQSIKTKGRSEIKQMRLNSAVSAKAATPKGRSR